MYKIQEIAVLLTIFQIKKKIFGVKDRNEVDLN